MANSLRLPRPEAVFVEPGAAPSKREILQAALRLFAQRGIHSVTIRDIAQESGYSNPALFKFFKSKDALALFLFERCYLDLYDKVEKRLVVAVTFEARIHGLVQVYIEQLDRDPGMVLYVQDHLRELWPLAAKETRARSIVKLIHNLLQGGVEEGAVERGPDLRLLGAAVVGTLTQFARLAYFGEFARPFARYAPELTRILTNIAAKERRAK